jgi:hypothetical protein
MNDSNLILEFLLKNYEVNSNGFFDKNSNIKLYGFDISKDLEKIFSVEEKIIETVIYKWSLEYVTLDVIKKHWNNVNIYPEPKIKNRFLVTFPQDFNIPNYIVKEVSRPSANFINGICVWDELTIKFYDLINPSTSAFFIDLMNFDENNRRKIDNVFTLYLESLDPLGDVIERFRFANCFITSVNFSNFDYSSNDLSECEIKIKFDDFILEI